MSEDPGPVRLLVVQDGSAGLERVTRAVESAGVVTEAVTPLEVGRAVTESAWDGVVTPARTMHDRRRLFGERLYEVQKMEALGRLAAGVAHDFNNVLQTILASCSLLLEEPETAARQELLEEILRGCSSAAALTRQLLDIGRSDRAEPGGSDAGRVVREVARLLERVLGEDIRLEVEVDPTPLWVRGNAGGLEQILLNLAINARDAMPRGGVLRLEARAVTLADEDICDHPLARPGPHVMLQVVDTGTGIPPEILDHIFEPFFTTKPADRGTGLGLASTYGIVRRLGGHLRVDTSVGEGSRFRIYLPRDRHGGAVAQARGTPRLGVEGGTERLLLVDDNVSVLRLMQRVLERSGYTVLTATSGEEAVALLDRHVDLVILDVVLPGLGGRELMHRFKEVHPEVRVLLTSGYSADEVAHRLEGPDAFLEKPFTPKALLEAIRAVLE